MSRVINGKAAFQILRRSSMESFGKRVKVSRGVGEVLTRAIVEPPLLDFKERASRGKNERKSLP